MTGMTAGIVLTTVRIAHITGLAGTDIALGVQTGTDIVQADLAGKTAIVRDIRQDRVHMAEPNPAAKPAAIQMKNAAATSAAFFIL